MILMQSAEADLNWSRLLAQATEAGTENKYAEGILVFCSVPIQHSLVCRVGSRR